MDKKSFKVIITYRQRRLFGLLPVKETLICENFVINGVPIKNKEGKTVGFERIDDFDFSIDKDKQFKVVPQDAVASVHVFTI